VQDGNSLATACLAAGIGQSTLYAWIRKAEDTEHAITTGQPYDPYGLALTQFRDRLGLARARASERAQRAIRRSMEGGRLLSEKAQLDGEGRVVRDDDGNILFERTYSQPDGKLALAWLGRSAPMDWGQSATQRIEVMIDGVRPGEEHDPSEGPPPGGDAISRMAERLAATVAQHRAEKAAQEAGDAEAMSPMTNGTAPQVVGRTRFVGSDTLGTNSVPGCGDGL